MVIGRSGVESREKSVQALTIYYYAANTVANVGSNVANEPARSTISFIFPSRYFVFRFEKLNIRK